ncbi:hypothetical protein DMI60_22940 [Escherichia coli]|nr:hypothetical protein [Escherichia coli]
MMRYLKPLCSRPMRREIFWKYIYQSRCASFATCKPYARNPPALLKSLRAYYSDVLWSVETSEGDGYIYCVIEHQSSAEKNMAFRLMRYATAAMQRHRTKAMTESRWWYHCCFIMAKPRPTRTHSTGWMSLTIRNLPGSCTPKLFRWWISPSYLTMRSCNIGV